MLCGVGCGVIGVVWRVGCVMWCRVLDVWGIECCVMLGVACWVLCGVLGVLGVSVLCSVSGEGSGCGGVECDVRSDCEPCSLCSSIDEVSTLLKRMQ